MQFNSVDFMLFFPIVLAVYFVIPKKGRLYWLLAASYYFYMSWNVKYALLIGTSTVITFLCGILLARFSDQEKKKKLVLALCILINLAILGLFKYGNFAIESANRLFSLLHISTIKGRFHFMLPVGISFYTFQALGYIIDVYRGDVEPERNIFQYALFISFFPQLVAGPIERSKNMLGQIRNIEKTDLWNARRIISGTILMIWGLFMKMVIADRLSIPVDTVYDHYRMYGSTELLLAAIGFMLQIYCDFGSYSMIAIGAAKILGIDLMENFNAPFFAKSIGEHWTRWHISLSSWFRDYVYIPLGGNRKGKFRTAVNTLIIFALSGLWHGSDWRYVAWGTTHGLIKIAEDVTKPLRKKIIGDLNVNNECFSYRLFQTLTTFMACVFATIFFRSKSITDAFVFMGRIITRPDPWILFNGGLLNLGLDRTEADILIVSLVILFLADLVRYKKGLTIDRFLLSQNLVFEWAIVILLIVMIFVFGEYGPVYDAKQFIYFQF